MVLRMIVAYAHSMNHVPYAVVANKPDIHQTQTNGNDKTIQAITERSPAVPLAVDFQLPQLVRLGFSALTLGLKVWDLGACLITEEKTKSLKFLGPRPPQPQRGTTRRQ